jgi:hypothetical protein
MALRKTRTLLTTLSIIVGTGIVAFFCWESDVYRAVTPLVFIFGLLVLFTTLFRQIKNFFNGAVIGVRVGAARIVRSEEKKLWRRHIPQLVTNLYFTHIQQYPEWIRESRDYVPSSVTTAGRTAEGQVIILLYYAQYTFMFTPFAVTDGEQQQGILEVIREGRRVLLLRVLQSITKKGVVYWVPTSVEAFEMSQEWMREFENLKAEILAIIKNRAREARES